MVLVMGIPRSPWGLMQHFRQECPHPPPPASPYTLSGGERRMSYVRGFGGPSRTKWIIDCVFLLRAVSPCPIIFHSCAPLLIHLHLRRYGSAATIKLQLAIARVRSCFSSLMTVCGAVDRYINKSCTHAHTQCASSSPLWSTPAARLSVLWGSEVKNCFSMDWRAVHLMFNLPWD